MILKISKNELKEKPNSKYFEHRDWWIFGEIERIYYTYLDGRAEIEPLYFDLSMLYEDIDERHKNEMLKIIIRYPDIKKDTYSILLQDCVCYLCNEDGKTVDKLVC